MGAVVLPGHPAPQPALCSSRQRSSSVTGKRIHEVGGGGDAANLPLQKEVSE